LLLRRLLLLHPRARGHGAQVMLLLLQELLLL
jgi:hypothetical protein